MKVIANITVVLGKKEYAPDSEIDISNEEEANSLLNRGFVRKIGKTENKQTSTPPPTNNSQKTDKNNAKNKKETENSGPKVPKSGG